MGDWGDRYYRVRLAFQLKGQALQYVESLPEDEIRTKEGLIAALQNRYQGKGARKDARDDLRVVKKMPKESPEDYGLRIQGLTKTAFPGSQVEQNEEGVSAFLRGLQDQRIAEILVAARKTCVQDCHGLG